MDVPQSIGSKRNKWIGRFVVASVLSVIVYGAFWCYASVLDAACKTDFRIVLDSVLDADTRLTEANPDWLRSTGRATPPLCAGCDAPYVYRPLDSPAITGGETDATTPVRLMSWCPKPCHLGHRNVLFETGLVVPIPESDFQRMVANGYVTNYPEITRAVNRVDLSPFWWLRGGP